MVLYLWLYGVKENVLMHVTQFEFLCIFNLNQMNFGHDGEAKRERPFKFIGISN